MGKCIVAAIMFTCCLCWAGERGLGFSFDVSGSGYIRPKLKTVVITHVISGGAAEMAGLQVGDRVISVNGCTIPGCLARKAWRLLKQPPGSSLALTVVRGHKGAPHSIVITQ